MASTLGGPRQERERGSPQEEISRLASQLEDHRTNVLEGTDLLILQEVDHIRWRLSQCLEQGLNEVGAKVLRGEIDRARKTFGKRLLDSMPEIQNLLEGISRCLLEITQEAELKTLEELAADSEIAAFVINKRDRLKYADSEHREDPYLRYKVWIVLVRLSHQFPRAYFSAEQICDYLPSIEIKSKRRVADAISRGEEMFSGEISVLKHIVTSGGSGPKALTTYRLCPVGAEKDPNNIITGLDASIPLIPPVPVEPPSAPSPPIKLPAGTRMLEELVESTALGREAMGIKEHMLHSSHGEERPYYYLLMLGLAFFAATPNRYASSKDIADYLAGINIQIPGQQISGSVPSIFVHVIKRIEKTSNGNIQIIRQKVPGMLMQYRMTLSSELEADHNQFIEAPTEMQEKKANPPQKTEPKESVDPKPTLTADIEAAVRETAIGQLIIAGKDKLLRQLDKHLDDYQYYRMALALAELSLRGKHVTAAEVLERANVRAYSPSGTLSQVVKMILSVVGTDKVEVEKKSTRDIPMRYLLKAV